MTIDVLAGETESETEREMTKDVLARDTESETESVTERERERTRERERPLFSCSGGGHGKLPGSRINSGVSAFSPKHCGNRPLARNMSHDRSERSRSPKQGSRSYEDESNNFSVFNIPSLVVPVLTGGDDSGADSSSGAGGNSGASGVPVVRGTSSSSGAGNNSGASGVHNVVYVDEPSGDEACSKCMALAQRVKQLKAEVQSLQQKLEKSEEGLTHTENTLADVMVSFVPPTSPNF